VELMSPGHLEGRLSVQVESFGQFCEGKNAGIESLFFFLFSF
jgi:hypothetical protein